MKIDVEHIRAVNPEIVYARGSAVGVRGPEARRGGAAMSYGSILFEVAGGIARLTLNRPDRLNSFNDAKHRSRHG